MSMLLKITLSRSPALNEYGPEEDQVLGCYKAVELTYSTLRVWSDDKEREQIGRYDHKKGVWWVAVLDDDLTAWSEIHIEPIEG